MFSVLPFRFAALLVCCVAAFLCAPGCVQHPQDGGTGDGPDVVTITPAEVAARIRRVADSLVRIYPDKPGVAAVASAISAAAAFVESGRYQDAGAAIVEAARLWPAFREYALLASLALELLSPGPESGMAAKSTGAPSTWIEAVKRAAPE